MENQNSKIENQDVAKVENVQPKEKKTSPKKGKKESSDAINIDKIKIDLSKGKKDMLTKTNPIAGKKDIYKSTEGMGIEEKKKFRGKIRRELHRFVNGILGKDRSNEERIASVRNFLKFYKTHWKFQDFKIENFTHTNNLQDRKDYETLLKYVQSVLK